MTGIRLALALAVLVTVAACAATDRLSLSHRRTPVGEARIVVLPVALPAGAVLPADGDGEALASLYTTELLRTYEILEYERFEQSIAKRGLSLDSLLVNGTGKALADELGIDAVLVSQVYSWTPGKPGILFLAKEGRVGFLARLVELRTGSVIWSVNRVRKTAPDDPLSVGLTQVFADIAAVLPAKLTPY